MPGGVGETDEVGQTIVTKEAGGTGLVVLIGAVHALALFLEIVTGTVQAVVQHRLATGQPLETVFAQ